MMKIRKGILNVVVTSIAVLLLIALLFPILWIISSSLKPYSSLFSTEFQLIPANATLEAYEWVLFESRFWEFAKNTVIVYLTTILSALLVTVPAAYGFSRFSFKAKAAILNSYFILAQFMSGMSVIALIGLYLFLVKIHLVDSLFVVGLIYAATTVPYVTWYLKTYFDTVPREYDEAAFLDGASFLQNLIRVIIPISRPGIIVAIIFITLLTLSEWVIAGILLSSHKFTLPVALVTLQGRWETPWNKFAAMSIIYSLPLLILFMLSHKNIEKGMSMSGLKG